MRKNKTKTLDFGNKMFFSILFVCATVIAAIVVYSITQSHPPNEILPQGSGSSLDADLVDGLQASDLQAQGGGGGSGGGMTCFTTCGTSSSVACPAPPDGYGLIQDAGVSLHHSVCVSAGSTRNNYGRGCCYYPDASAATTTSPGSYKSAVSSAAMSGNYACATKGGECVTTFNTDGSQINCNQGASAVAYSICKMINGYGGTLLTYWSGQTIYSTGDNMCAKLEGKGMKCVRAYTQAGSLQNCNWQSTSLNPGAALCEPWS